MFIFSGVLLVSGGTGVLFDVQYRTKVNQ